MATTIIYVKGESRMDHLPMPSFWDRRWTELQQTIYEQSIGLEVGGPGVGAMYHDNGGKRDHRCEISVGPDQKIK